MLVKHNHKADKTHHTLIARDGLSEVTLGKKGNGSSCQEPAFGIKADIEKERKHHLFSYFLTKTLEMS